MVEGHIELGFLLQVAGVTKLGLRLDQQEIRFFAVVRRMAGNAAHVIPRVLRGDDVHVLRATGVADEAARVDVLRGSVLEPENFGYVASPRDVLLARTMARFTAMPLRAFLGKVVEGGRKMARALEVLDETLARHIFVAGLAGFFAHIERGVGGLRIAFLVRLVGWSRPFGFCAKPTHGQRQEERENE